MNRLFILFAFYRRPPAPFNAFTVLAAATLSRAAPVSSAASPCISINLVKSNLGFFNTLTLRIKTFCKGKIDWHFFSISNPIESGVEMLESKEKVKRHVNQIANNNVNKFQHMDTLFSIKLASNAHGKVH
jgi:hypothetical protein